MSTKPSRRAHARFFSSFTFGLAVASALALSTTANARQLGAIGAPHLGGCTNCNVFQLATATGEPQYVVPHGKWTITHWGTQGGGSASGQSRLQVFRPTATAGQFKLIARSNLETTHKNGHPYFATNIDVRGGDLLGFATVDNISSAYSTSVTGDNVKIVACTVTGVGQRVGAGTSCALADLAPELVNVRVKLIRR